MANPTVVSNTNNAFIAPTSGFPFPQAAAVMEVQNADTVTLTQGMLVQVVTGGALTAPMQVQRSTTTADSLKIGFVIGEAALPSQTGGPSQSGGLPQPQVIQRQAGTTTIMTNGFCVTTATGAVTAGDWLIADTTTRGNVKDSGIAAAGPGTLALIGQVVGIALQTIAGTGSIQVYACKF